VASLLSFLTPKVFASLCVQMHSHLPAAIPELCTGGAPIPHLNQQAFFTTIEPLSFKFLMIR
jgi:hypothetical protein